MFLQETRLLSFQSSSHGIFLFLKLFIFVQIHLYWHEYFKIVDSEIAGHPSVGFLHVPTRVTQT